MEDIYVVLTFVEQEMTDVSGFPTEAEARAFALEQLAYHGSPDEEAVDLYSVTPDTAQNDDYVVHVVRLVNGKDEDRIGEYVLVEKKGG